MKFLRVANYLTFTAIRNLRAAWLLHSITIGTLATTFLIVGGAALVTINARNMVVSSTETQLTVYFRDGRETEGKEAVQRAMCGQPFVAACRYRSVEEARTLFLRQNPELEQAVKALRGNPFPASLEIVLDPEVRDTTRLTQFSAEVRKLDSVEAVDDIGHWGERWSRLLDLIDRTLFALGLALSLAMMFLVANTVRLGVYARRDEVEILSLVGASGWMIRAPFVLEGMVQGGIAALLSIAGLSGLFQYFHDQVVAQWGSYFASPPQFFSSSVILLYLAAGTFLGMAGSALAVRRYLR